MNFLKFTKKNKAEECKKSQIFLTHLMKHTVDYLILVDDKLNLAYCSDSFLRKVGARNFEKIKDRNILDIYASFADDELFTHLSNMLTDAVKQTETTTHNISANIDDSGDQRTYRITNTPMLDKNISGVIINWNDITDISEATEKAENASRAKSDFLSKMSHEIRTPMSAIMGMTTIGLKAKDVRQKDFTLDRVKEASLHLLTIVNDVLDISKIEANKLELAPAEFVFDDMLQQVLNIIKFQADKKRQNLIVNIDDNIPSLLFGDDKRLTQVLTNLLSNAIKFTPKSGDVSLNVSLVDETDDACSLFFEVVDTGIGISSEQQKRLFRAFEQADSGTSREFGGTGLGLAISQSIVELMGGKICVDSNVGSGATFSFTIAMGYKRESIQKNEASIRGMPIVETITDDHSNLSDKITKINDFNDSDDEKPSKTAPFKGKRVLLAEDIEINREILIALLEDTGITIDCVENGIDAVATIAENPDKYDMILMDLQMPKMDGFEATRQIRRLPGRSAEDLPIVAITANVFKEDVDACMDAGMNGHIGKPLDIDELTENLRKFL